ncbi:zf-ZPR1-domain-containing protein [Hygrophoropsis aurantiaca]|uniref:Zf-ZPR1-domain-containing protein n=1 Tax=Hygrophoropsis aurantiaca TaxID=72124 RepID=A0ACB8AML5_9AGAM|nr:zf-ZPR1-domain-containing protein [Hygrophoropsis aurantiaca]
MSQRDFFPSISKLAEQVDAADGSDAQNLAGEQDSIPLEEVESLCMRCEEQGVTRMMLTTIPFFGKVIVMSFRCEHCGGTNNEIQSAGQIRQEGVLYTVKLLNRGDLDRQIIRSEHCSIEIPEYELILPPSRGQLTTVEGLLRDVVIDLSTDQPLRRIQDEATYEKIQTIIDGLKVVIAEEEDDEAEDGAEAKPKVQRSDGEPINPAITIKLDDPSGNSFIEFHGKQMGSDPKWNLRTFQRTKQQDVAMGLAADEEAAESSLDPSQAPPDEGDGNEEIYEFPGVCSRCGRPLITRMKKVTIPYFKDTLIMSTNCESCGYRDNEIKSGAAISELGKKITLKVEDREDLSRDILKSETSGMTIPEIDLVLQPGTLGGRFTTLEGILDQVYEELSEKVFRSGDSTTGGVEERDSFEAFLKNLKEVKNAERPFTLILDDPLANSYIQNLYAPDPDPNMVIETYERTWDQNEELGLNDMKVESYDSSEETDTTSKAPSVPVET